MNHKLPERYRGITPQRAVSKFTSLKNQFKRDFFKPDGERKTFLYYDKMNKMFTDYAMKKLNETNYDSIELDMNQSAMLVNSIIGNVLDSDSEKFNEKSESDHQYSGHSSRVETQSNKIQKELSQLEPGSLYISKTEKMRIDPNTPFNRRINQSSLLNQRSSFVNSYQNNGKRRLLNDPEFNSKRQKQAPKVNSTEVDYGDDLYVVEALEECELSSIAMRQSKIIYRDENSTNLSPSDNFEEPSSKQASIVEVSSTLNDTKMTSESGELTNSIVIPAYNFTSDYESDQSSIGILRNAPHVDLNLTAKSTKVLAPKTLNLLQEIQNVSTTTNRMLIEKLKQNKQISITKIATNSDEEHPLWFKEFLVKYERDMKSINSKLESLIAAGKSSK